MTLGATTMTLRPLASGDIDAVQRLDVIAHGESWSTRLMKDQISEACFDHRVAVAAGQVVGHAATWKRESTMMVTTVAVDESATGLGIATRLLLALLHEVDAAVGSVRLEVRPSNRRAQRLYGRFGFAPIGCQRGFYRRCDDTGSRDALVMVVAHPHDDVWRQRLASIHANLEETGAAA